MGIQATAILYAVNQADPAMGAEFKNALKANPAFEDYLDNLQDPKAWGEELKNHATPANADAFKKALADISTQGNQFDFSQLDIQNMGGTVANYNAQLAQATPPQSGPSQPASGSTAQTQSGLSQAPSGTTAQTQSGPSQAASGTTAQTQQGSSQPATSGASQTTATNTTGGQTQTSTTSGGQTYSELKESLIKAGQTDLADSLDHAGQDFQNSLMYALNENPHFGPYILQSMSSPNGASNFLTDTLDELFIKDKDGNLVANPDEAGAKLMDSQKVQVVTNILHEIGNGDIYQSAADFKLLDDVAKASKDLKSISQTNDSEKIKDATHNYYLALNAAGGHLPAMATFELSDAFQFIADVFDPNVSMDMAIGNLVDNLGLDPSSAQAADVQAIGEKMGGFLEFFGGEAGSGGYGDLFRNIANDEYGFNDSIKNMTGLATRAYNGAAVGQTNQVLNNAATVPVVDDVKFSADVETHLRGLPTPNLGNVFDAMRNAVPGGAAHEEINALQKAVNQGKLELTDNFKDALSQKDFAKIGDITNDLYNELEDGDSPAVAANQSQFAVAMP